MQGLTTRNTILSIEDKIRSILEHMEGDCFPLTHRFADGIYCREIRVPAGYLIVTKLFKQSHATFLLVGEVSILTEQGIQRIKAPCSLITSVGTKRVIYVHKACVWTTVHQNPKQLTDIGLLEEDIIAKDYKELDTLEQAFIKVFSEESCRS
jgi:hypothetical protein